MVGRLRRSSGRGYDGLRRLGDNAADEERMAAPPEAREPREEEL